MPSKGWPDAILRPPLAQNSLERQEDGRVVLQLKRAWRDGTTAVVFEPLDLMSKLSALIPRPRTNTIRFHGVFASAARLRSRVIPIPPTHDACGHKIETDPNGKSHRLLWAQLLARVFQVDVFRCPRCSSRMSRIAWVLDTEVIRAILTSMELATAPPDPHPPRFEEYIN